MRVCDLTIDGELRVRRRFAGGERIGDAGGMRAVGLDGVDRECALSVSPASGSGNGSVTVTASANASGTQQTFTATIASQTFSATVAAVSCTYKFSANAPDQNGNAWVVPADGSQRGVTVTVTPNDGTCAPWKASSNADWITVSPTSGTTSATVRIDYSANNTADARTGNVFLRPDCTGADCGFTVTLNQSGRPTFMLRLTLVQGEQLSGPYEGVVTGPNGFSCSLRRAYSVSCPRAAFAAGSTVPLAVALDPNPADDRAIWMPETKGCDRFAGPATCVVNMTGDRDVTIGIGCSICFSPVAEIADLLLVSPQPPQFEAVRKAFAPLNRKR